MDNLESIKEKLASKENFDKVLESTFANCYSCTRVWSAWSYGTMSIDDFAPFERDDEAFDEMNTTLKNILDNKKINDFDEFIKVIEDVIGNYTLYYNDDIGRSFDSQCFHEDILDYVDLTELNIANIRYQASHLQKEPENTLTTRNKLSI